MDTQPSAALDPGRLAALPADKRRLLEQLMAGRAPSTGSGSSTVAYLRKGAGDPIVLVHPVGGETLCYGELVQHLLPGRPCVAIRADRKLAGPDAPAMSELAAHYLQLLDQAGVRPGVLAGWSFGGVTAYEMARQAAAQGRVRPVVLLDAMPRPARLAEWMPPQSEILQYFVRSLIMSGGGDPNQYPFEPDVWTSPVPVALTVAVATLAARGLIVGLPQVELEARYRIYRNAVETMSGYDPQPYGYPVHLVRATQWTGDDPTEVWQKVIDGPLHVTDFDTDHHGLLVPPFVDAVARVIDSAAEQGVFAEPVASLRKADPVPDVKAVEPTPPPASAGPAFEPTPPPASAGPAFEPAPPPASARPAGAAVAGSTMRIVLRGSVDPAILDRAAADVLASHPSLRGGCCTVTSTAAGDIELALALPCRLDATSVRVVCADIERAYLASAPSRRDPRLPAEQVQAYWQDRVPSEAARRSWPYQPQPEADAPAGTTAEPAAATRTAPLEVPDHIAAGLRERAVETGSTPLALLVCAVQSLLARVQNSDGPLDVTVGAVVPAERGEGPAQQVGELTATVTCRQQIDPQRPFSELLSKAGRLLAEDLPYAAPAAHPAVAVSVEVDGGPPAALSLGGAVSTQVWPEDPSRPGCLSDGIDLHVRLWPAGGGYSGLVRCRADRYVAGTPAVVAESLQLLLGHVAVSADTPIGELPVARPLPAGAGAPDGLPLRAVELVERTAADSPHAAALRWTGGAMTYRELLNAADALAERLRGARLVAVCLPRSPELAVAVLATMRAGAGVVPLDPAYPAQRLEMMLADSGAQVLVTDRELIASTGIRPGCRLVLTDPATPGLPSAGQPSAGQPRDPDPGLPAAGEVPDLAYVIYTSGSTGIPKGVAMAHPAFADMLAWQRGRSAAGPGWNTLQFAPISFDVSFQELFATWATGGTVVLTDEELRRDPRRLLAHLDDFVVHRLFLPFVALRLLAETADRLDRFPRALKEVITAGEQPRLTAPVRRFFAETGASLDNQYGPTEAHPASAELLRGPVAEWPLLPTIGRARAGAVVDVLDARLQPLPAGITGQICVAGPCLAEGYLNRPDVTADRFRDLPGRGRLYLTGDLGRRTPDDRIEFLGRADDQVKIRGHRVEPGEVEARLAELPGVADAVVVTAPTDDGPALVAHVVPSVSPAPTARQLRAELARSLPEYMLPARVEFLDRFPLAPTGKVDRAALAGEPAAAPSSAPAVGSFASAEPSLPLTQVSPPPAEAGPPPAEASAPPAEAGPPPAEASAPPAGFEPHHLSDADDDGPTAHAVVRGLWQEMLGVSGDDEQVSMFELGANSLTATRIAARLEDSFAIEVPVVELFLHNTIEAQAALVEKLLAQEIGRFSDAELSRALTRLTVGGA